MIQTGCCDVVLTLGLIEKHTNSFLQLDIYESDNGPKMTF